jgi:hypothetical protein
MKCMAVYRCMRLPRVKRFGPDRPSGRELRENRMKEHTKSAAKIKGESRVAGRLRGGEKTGG